MFVQDRMSTPAITVTPATSFQTAMDLMHSHQIRRLPVVDETNAQLVGIVSERDILTHEPRRIPNLSDWESRFLLARLHVREMMTPDVIATTPDTSIEEAAHLMVSYKIGGLPVINTTRQVVGVITETDIFKTFLEMFAGDYSGLRLTLRIPSKPDALCGLSQTICDQGGNIVSIGSFNGGAADTKGLVLKVKDTDQQRLVYALEEIGDQVLDARQV